MSMQHAEERLFDEWKQKRPGSQFVPDGVCDEQGFRRIVFLLKEANDTREVSDLDLRNYMRSGARGATWNNIVRWTRAAVEYPASPSWDAVSTVGTADRQETLLKVAAMNLKKVPGRATCDNRRLQEIATADADLLRRQLDLYEPDLVICCGTWWLAAPIFELHGEPTQVPGCEVRFRYLRQGRTTFIDTLHPGARPPNRTLYESFVAGIRRAREA